MPGARDRRRRAWRERRGRPAGDRRRPGGPAPRAGARVLLPAPRRGRRPAHAQAREVPPRRGVRAHRADHAPHLVADARCDARRRRAPGHGRDPGSRGPAPARQVGTARRPAPRATADGGHLLHRLARRDGRLGARRDLARAQGRSPIPARRALQHLVPGLGAPGGAHREPHQRHPVGGRLPRRLDPQPPGRAARATARRSVGAAGAGGGAARALPGRGRRERRAARDRPGRPADWS